MSCGSCRWAGPRAQDPPASCSASSNSPQCFRTAPGPASRRDRAEPPEASRRATGSLTGIQPWTRSPKVSRPVGVSGPVRDRPSPGSRSRLVHSAEPAGQVRSGARQTHTEMPASRARSAPLGSARPPRRIVATGMRFGRAQSRRQPMVGQAELGELGEVLLVAHPEPVAVPDRGLDQRLPPTSRCAAPLPSVCSDDAPVPLDRRETVAPSGSGRRLCRHVGSALRSGWPAGLSAAREDRQVLDPLTVGTGPAGSPSGSMVSTRSSTLASSVRTSRRRPGTPGGRCMPRPKPGAGTSGRPMSKRIGSTNTILVAVGRRVRGQHRAPGRDRRRRRSRSSLGPAHEAAHRRGQRIISSAAAVA